MDPQLGMASAVENCEDSCSSSDENKASSSGGGGLITEAIVLESTSDDRIEIVTQLILRGRGYTGFDPGCIAKLQRLSVLSLSSNRLTSLEDFHHLPNLLELNLNFNGITSVEGLRCPGLRRLCLSSNRLTSVSGLEGFPRISSLCLYRNYLTDLPATLSTLRRLHKIRELDLDGNPCARLLGYRHHVVRALPRIELLDGDAITSLDRDLSALHFAESVTNDSVGTGRPQTAPVGGRPYSGGRDPRLLRNEKLNNDPVLLAYLAESALEEPAGSQGDILDELRKRATDEQDQEEETKSNEDIDYSEHGADDVYEGGDSIGGNGVNSSRVSTPDAGFVARLRETATISSRSDDSKQIPSDSPNSISIQAAERSPKVSVARPSSSGSGQNVGISNSTVNMDPSDPHTTIRRLLKLVEVLQIERDRASPANVTDHVTDTYTDDYVHKSSNSVEATVRELTRDVQRLTLENRNMEILLEENRTLRQKLASEETASRENVALRNEVDVLRREVAVLTLQLETLELEAGTLRDNAATSSEGWGGNAENRYNRSSTAAETLIVCEDVDDELAELFRRNEQMISELHRDVELTKREVWGDTLNTPTTFDPAPEVKASYRHRDSAPADVAFRRRPATAIGTSSRKVAPKDPDLPKGSPKDLPSRPEKLSAEERSSEHSSEMTSSVIVPKLKLKLESSSPKVSPPKDSPPEDLPKGSTPPSVLDLLGLRERGMQQDIERDRPLTSRSSRRPGSRQGPRPGSARDGGRVTCAPGASALLFDQ